MSTDIPHRSDCPIASALDIVGDRWTLLILRDMLYGASRFSDFSKAAEGIRRNILTERLRRLEQRGLVVRRQYQDRPARFSYHLTPRGAELLPAIKALAAWGTRHVHHACDPPDIPLHWTPEHHVETPSGGPA
jgi:DNA-binding HxlR family transcriptional regulator